MKRFLPCNHHDFRMVEQDRHTEQIQGVVFVGNSTSGAEIIDKQQALYNTYGSAAVYQRDKAYDIHGKEILGTSKAFFITLEAYMRVHGEVTGRIEHLLPAIDKLCFQFDDNTIPTRGHINFEEPHARHLGWGYGHPILEFELEYDVVWLLNITGPQAKEHQRTETYKKFQRLYDPECLVAGPSYKQDGTLMPDDRGIYVTVEAYKHTHGCLPFPNTHLQEDIMPARKLVNKTIEGLKLAIESSSDYQAFYNKTGKKCEVLAYGKERVFIRTEKSSKNSGETYELSTLPENISLLRKRRLSKATTRSVLESTDGLLYWVIKENEGSKLSLLGLSNAVVLDKKFNNIRDLRAYYGDLGFTVKNGKWHPEGDLNKGKPVVEENPFTPVDNKINIGKLIALGACKDWRHWFVGHWPTVYVSIDTLLAQIIQDSGTEGPLTKQGLSAHSATLWLQQKGFLEKVNAG